MFHILESVKYYRDFEGFVYKKSGENTKTIYLDCLRQPNCIAGARYYKDSRELVRFSDHSDEKPDVHLVHKIGFEEHLKNEVCKSENAKMSVLNLYKRAKNAQFKGVWLPPDHQTLFLAKLRRMRNYEKKEKPKTKNQQNLIDRARVQMVDVATSPNVPECVIMQSIASLDGENVSDVAVDNASQSIEKTQSSSSTEAATSLTLPLSISNQNSTPSNQKQSTQSKVNAKNVATAVRRAKKTQPFSSAVAATSPSVIANQSSTPSDQKQSKVNAKNVCFRKTTQRNADVNSSNETVAKSSRSAEKTQPVGANLPSAIANQSKVNANTVCFRNVIVNSSNGLKSVENTQLSSCDGAANSRPLPLLIPIQNVTQSHQHVVAQRKVCFDDKNSQNHQKNNIVLDSSKEETVKIFLSLRLL